MWRPAPTPTRRARAASRCWCVCVGRQAGGRVGQRGPLPPFLLHFKARSQPLSIIPARNSSVNPFPAHPPHPVPHPRQECMLERADEPVAAALLAMAAQQQVGGAGGRPGVPGLPRCALVRRRRFNAAATLMLRSPAPSAGRAAVPRHHAAAGGDVPSHRRVLHAPAHQGVKGGRSPSGWGACGMSEACRGCVEGLGAGTARPAAAGCCRALARHHPRLPASCFTAPAPTFMPNPACTTPPFTPPPPPRVTSTPGTAGSCASSSPAQT